MTTIDWSSGFNSKFDTVDDLTTSVLVIANGEEITKKYKIFSYNNNPKEERNGVKDNKNN